MHVTAIPQHQDTRHRIVETAERFFRDIGYQKTTVADIAKALRMSPANVYRFFDSKKAINEAVAERLMAEVESALEAIAAAPEPAPVRLRRLLETAHAMNATRYVGDIRIHEMVEVAMSESWDVIKGHIQRVDVIHLRVLADGVASGEFAAQDPALAAACVRTAFVRFCHPQLIEQCADLPGPQVGQMIDFVLAALSPR
jgi:AcrR family transcriptional regulator